MELQVNWVHAISICGKEAHGIPYSQPTAYDVDNVVERLKYTSQNIALIYPTDQEYYYEHSDGIEINRAVEIVKSELKEQTQ